MEIKIGDDSTYLLIKDIVPEGQDFGYDDSNDVEFLRGTIELNVTDISTRIRTSFMVSEFKHLLTDLKKLYDTLKYGFKFEIIEGNIELLFKPQPNGHIQIEGYLKNSTYTSSIKFKMDIDQTYLPHTIRNLKEVLDEIRIR